MTEKNKFFFFIGTFLLLTVQDTPRDRRKRETAKKKPIRTFFDRYLLVIQSTSRNEPRPSPSDIELALLVLDCVHFQFYPRRTMCLRLYINRIEALFFGSPSRSYNRPSQIQIERQSIKSIAMHIHTSHICAHTNTHRIYCFVWCFFPLHIHAFR